MLVQTSIWGGSDVGWINLNDTQDQLNTRMDLHKVEKAVQAQVTAIGDTVKRANDAVDQANKAIDSSNVNKAAIDAANSAIAEAKQSASDAVQKLQSVESSVNTTSDEVTKVKRSQAGQIKDVTNQINDAVTQAKAAADSLDAKTTALQTAVKNAQSDATVATQTAQQASVTAIDAKGDATAALATAKQVTVDMKNAESDIMQAKTTASEATITAGNAASDALVAKATASSANLTATNASSDVAQVSAAADSLSTRVTTVEGKTAANSTAIDENAKAITLKADQASVDALKTTVTDNSAAVSVLNDEIKLKVDTTTVNKIVDGKGFATTNTVQSLVDQKAGQISQTIANVQSTVDKNGKAISSTNDKLTNVTQTVDGLQTTVKTKTDQSVVNQLSNQLLAKVSTKDYQAEIALLTKDLNLRVSKGDLISQINLEAGGDGLISVQNGKGKLMLDADSVVFGNKAFIPSAAITNIQADQITSGTLNAGNMRVINLTADSIHGGTLDVGNMHVKNFSANDIKTGTLTGVKVKTGDKDRFFQTSRDNIYWVHDNSTSLIGTDTYLSPGGGMSIADQHNITISTWFGAQVKDDGTIVNSAGTYGWPKIIIDSEGRLNPDSPGGANWYTGRGKTQIVQWIGDKEYLRLAVGEGARMHLNEDIARSEFDIQKDNCIGAYFGQGDHGNQINLVTTGNGQGVNVTGDFHVTGSKNSIINTKQGYLAINAYETAEYFFGDIGESNTGSTSQVVVGIDRIFNDLVNTNIQYQVFVTPYTDARIWVEKRYNNRFVVKSDKPNAEFGWELKAKRKGYESNRLRRVSVDVNPLQLKGETN